MNSKIPIIEFRPHNLTIMVDVKYPYEIDLEACNSTAQVLDFILQVSGKTWATDETVGKLVRCFKEAAKCIFNEQAQGVMCPWGNHMKIDWAKGETTMLDVTPRAPSKHSQAKP
jgi:hypothetical protein